MIWFRWRGWERLALDLIHHTFLRLPLSLQFFFPLLLLTISAHLLSLICHASYLICFEPFKGGSFTALNLIKSLLHLSFFNLRLILLKGVTLYLQAEPLSDCVLLVSQLFNPVLFDLQSLKLGEHGALSCP